ncbi:MAG TPA: DUF3617 family protein [Burkholderiales bacterium]
MSPVRLVARFALPALLLSAAGAFAAPNFDEGLWEFEMKMAVPGVSVAIPPVRYSQCLTRTNMVPSQPEQQGLPMKCEDRKPSVKGDTVSWTMRCTDGDTVMEGSGQVTYRGNRMHGSFKSTMRAKGRPGQTVTNEISGRRIGPCK